MRRTYYARENRKGRKRMGEGKEEDGGKKRKKDVRGKGKGRNKGNKRKGKYMRRED